MDERAVLTMVGGYMVRDVGSAEVPTFGNTRPCLEAAVRLACAIAEVNPSADLEIVDIATGKPADEDSVLDTLRVLEGSK